VLGEHTEEVLQQILGKTAQEMTQLRSDGIV
jgi:crotonobetainyl-CoA:carnitine CoA-transferase CaiB-like acyl-CoA transferase